MRTSGSLFGSLPSSRSFISAELTDVMSAVALNDYWSALHTLPLYNVGRARFV